MYGEPASVSRSNDLKKVEVNVVTADAKAKKNTVLIDNSYNTYIPVWLRCGVQLMCRPEVLDSCPFILEHLNSDLSQCLQILPVSVRRLVRRTRIWVNLSYCYGRYDQPEHINHTTAHHHEAWLLWAHDRPEKASGIEIYNCYDFIRMRNHWNGCGLILHELCHLIHQQILGLDCEHVKALYMRAQQSGRYNRVLRRDWAGKENGDTDLSYSMIDHKEFFAEMSVTYWSKGYNEFDQASGDNMNECTPLITDPTVLTRPGYKPGFNKAEGELLSGGAALLWVGSFMKYILPQKRHLLHCNKFYPFTSGQLRHYDPTLYLDMKNIWNDISMWEDPTYNHAYCSGCWIQPWVNKNGKRGLFEETVDVAGPLIVISDTVEL